MAGYIGSRSQVVSSTSIAKAQDFTATDTTPEVTIVNNTHEDTDGGREGKVIFKGQQSGGEESTLAEIEANHHGSSDDEKANLIFRTNDGSDGASPTERLRIDSNGSILTATLGTDNVRLGENAGDSIASGGNLNVTIGKDAGTAITTGTDNTFVGSNAGDALIDSDHNVAVGHQALTADTKGSKSTAVGAFSLNAQNFSSATDSNNTAVGYVAGAAITTGSNNTFVGAAAGDATDDGGNNTAVGKSALTSNCGDNNTAVGLEALRDTTGSVNTAIGKNSGNAITSGSKNTIIGAYNGNQDSVDIRTTDGNVVLSDGDGEPVYWHKGSENANILAGTAGGTAWGTASGVRVHAQGAAAQWMTISNTTTNATSETMIVHRIGAVTNGEAIQFYRAGSAVGSITVSSGSTSFNTSSDYRLKENVSDLTGATERLKQLQPKKFSWIDDKLDAADTEGFLAHEVQEIVPKSVAGDKDEMKEDKEGNTVPRYQSIDYSKLVPLLTASLQEAIAKIETLATKVAALEAG